MTRMIKMFEQQVSSSPKNQRRPQVGQKDSPLLNSFQKGGHKDVIYIQQSLPSNMFVDN